MTSRQIFLCQMFLPFAVFIYLATSIVVASATPLSVGKGTDSPNSIVYQMNARGCWDDVAPIGAVANVAVVRFTGDTDFTFSTNRKVVDMAINESVFGKDSKRIDLVAGFCEE